MSKCVFPNTTKSDISKFVEHTIPQMITKKVNTDKYDELDKKCDKYYTLDAKTDIVFYVSFLAILLVLAVSIVLAILGNFENEISSKIMGCILLSIIVVLGIFCIPKMYLKYQYTKYHRQCLAIKQPIQELFENKLYIGDYKSVVASIFEPDFVYVTDKDTIHGFESIFIIDEIKHLLESCNNTDNIKLIIHINDNHTVDFDVLVNDISYKQYTIDGPICITEFDKFTKNVKSSNTYDFTYLDDRFNEYCKMACEAIEKLENKE